VGYSQGTTVGTFGLAEMQEYFDKKVNLFVALAPSVLFLNSTEPVYKSLSGETALQDALLFLGYVEISMNEIGGHSKRDLSYEIKKDLPLVCYLAAQLCNPKMDAKSLDESPSIDLKRANSSRISFYLNMPDGTSLKNFIQMG